MTEEQQEVCPSAWWRQGTVVARCFKPPGHEGRHHNGSQWWSEGNTPAGASGLCRICGDRSVDRLPACAPCWTTVPMEAKRRLARRKFASEEYERLLEAVLDRMRAAVG